MPDNLHVFMVMNCGKKRKILIWRVFSEDPRALKIIAELRQKHAAERKARGEAMPVEPED